MKLKTSLTWLRWQSQSLLSTILEILMLCSAPFVVFALTMMWATGEQLFYQMSVTFLTLFLFSLVGYGLLKAIE